VLKTVYRSSCRDKHNCQRRDSNLDPLTPQSDALTTRLLRPETNEHAGITGQTGQQSSVANVFVLRVRIRDDNGSAGHGSCGSTNLSGSRGSRVSTRNPLTHDQVNKIPAMGRGAAK